MKKHFTTFMMLIMSLFLLPISVFASAENPIDKMGEKMKFNWSILDGADFIFSPVSILISIIVIGALLFTIIRVFIRVMKISSGKASIKDKWFWIEVGVIFLILFFFFSGAFFKFLSGIYDWTNNQDITGTK
ncbi:hypothetical protein [Paenibacillus solani]|uniref:hypothetical protein n=1 Tax=Paenibacillus solani TaxID=1705565 RepID=UPI003D29670E